MLPVVAAGDAARELRAQKTGTSEAQARGVPGPEPVWAGETLLVLSPALPAPASARVCLAAAAGRSGMSVVTVDPEDPLSSIRAALIAAGARAVLVCADAPTQAAAAGAAASLEVAFGCLPSSDTDILARDIGALPPASDDTEGPTSSGWLDLGEVNGIVFVNYVAIGVRVQPTSVGARIAPAASSDEVDGVLLPAHPGAPPSPHSLLVSNNRFCRKAAGLGTRERLDRGRLALTTYRDPAFVTGDETAIPREREIKRLELRARGRVVADIDGAARALAPPLRFRIRHRAVRVCAPRRSLCESLGIALSAPP